MSGLQTGWRNQIPDNPLQKILWYVNVLYENKEWYHGHEEFESRLREIEKKEFPANLLFYVPAKYWHESEGIQKAVVKVLEQRESP